MILIGLSIGLVSGIIFGCKITDEYWQDKSVEHNKAEYYLDNNYKKKWRWN